MAQAGPVAQRRSSVAVQDDDRAPVTSPEPVACVPTSGLAVLADAAVRRSGEHDSDPLGGSPIPADVLSVLRRRQGGGRSLTPGPATELGQSLGPVAAAARIHTDGEADTLARSVQSVAFSYGSDVYFSQGSYAPDTDRGQHLLAHELSHVAQGASSGGGAVIGRADDAAERDADRSADSVVGGLRRQASRVAATGAPALATPTGISRFAIGRPTLRRVYTEDERPVVRGLPQVGTDERVLELEAHNWTAANTRRLADMDPPPTYEQMNTIMAKFSRAQLQVIGAVTQNLAEVVALAASTWTGAEIATAAALAPAPSVAELTTAATFFSHDQFAILLGVCNSVANVAELAAAPGWTAAQLAVMAQQAPAPSAAELRTIAQFFTAAQVRPLWTVCVSVANLVTLTGTGWTAGQLAGQVAVPASRPTWDQLNVVTSRLTPGQQAALVGAVEPNWVDLARLATAAGPADQSPAITLRRALVACQAYIDEEIQELSDVGLAVDRRRYAALLLGTDAIQGTEYQIIMAYLRDARYFSICFDTARRLLNELGNVPGAESGGAPETNYALAQQQVRSAQLIQHINNAGVGGAPTIFDIHVGGHGFTLTVIGDAVYQLEAFASAANEDPGVLAVHGDLDMSLFTSIANNHTYTRAQVTTALGQMTSDQVAQRRLGAGAMGWNAGPCGFTTGAAITDPMAVWWKSSSLLSNAAIVVRLAERVQRQAAEIRATFGVDAR